MLAAALGELARTVLGDLTLVVPVWERGWLTNSATTQAQIQGFELAHLNIYLIYELLELMKGRFL